jgi:predicted CXXCH cytochrome family protein
MVHPHRALFVRPFPLVYNSRMSRLLRSLIPTLIACAPGFVSPPPTTAAESPGTPAVIEFVMPAAKAFIPAGSIVVAGKLPAGAGFLNLLLDGSPVGEISREGAAFSAVLTPAAGPHTLEARAGMLSSTLSFTYGVGGRDLAPYRYHAPVLQGRCAECHAGVRRGTASAEADTCKGCHRKLAMLYPYIHGPLAAGKCLVCHDPHGSRWPSLTLSDAQTMCIACHDQPGSLTHAQNARSRVCYLCHNPHASMNRKFLYDIVK